MAQPYHISIAPKLVDQPAQVSENATASTTFVRDQRYQNASARYDRATWESVQAEVTHLVTNLNMGPIAIERHFRDKQPPFIAKYSLDHISLQTANNLK